MIMTWSIRELLVASAAATALLALATPASAGFHHPSTPPVSNCTSIDSIKEWKDASNDTCTLGDKQYKFKSSSNLSQDADISFSKSQDGLTHTFKLDEDLKSGSSKKTYSIKYEVTVTDDDYVITAIDLLSSIKDEADGKTKITKKIYNAEKELIAILTNDESTSFATVSLNETFLIIEDIIEVAAYDKVCKRYSRGSCTEWKYEYDKVEWVKNVIHQEKKQDDPPQDPPTEVPEPETLALFGLGLLGLGYLGRRRKGA
jgi:hypothetical protein